MGESHYNICNGFFYLAIFSINIKLCLLFVVFGTIFALDRK